MKSDIVDKLIYLLEGNNRYLELECLNRLTSWNGTINMGSVMDRGHLIGVYKNRMNIANDVTSSGILGLEGVLDRLANIQSRSVRVLTITSMDIFTLFASDNLTELYGVVKTPYTKRSDNYIDKDAIYFNNGRID